METDCKISFYGVKFRNLKTYTVLIMWREIRLGKFIIRSSAEASVGSHWFEDDRDVEAAVTRRLITQGEGVYQQGIKSSSKDVINIQIMYK